MASRDTLRGGCHPPGKSFFMVSRCATALWRERSCWGLGWEVNGSSRALAVVDRSFECEGSEEERGIHLDTKLIERTGRHNRVASIVVKWCRKL